MTAPQTQAQPRYYGFPVVRMQRRVEGGQLRSTVPVCRVPCRVCGAPLERKHQSVNDALKGKYRGFRCQGGECAKYEALHERRKAILREESRASGFKVHDIVGRSQRNEILPVRRRAARRIRELGFSWSELGKVFGGRDSSTMIKMCDAGQEKESGR